MSLRNRNLVTIDDLSNGEIEGLFSLADEMSDSMNEQFGVCQGKIMASLFFEPSTRTRLSFEVAMHRLGGSVITVSDVGATSLSKGESIADMARIVGSYADIIIIRHPWEGAAKVVADYAGVPVINAGDGGHEHPTQTLCDLYTLKKELKERKGKRSVKGSTVRLLGDLKYGRAVHSLAYGLAKYGAKIRCWPIEGLDMAEHVLRKLYLDYDCDIDTTSDEGQADVLYISPPPRQLPLLPSVDVDTSVSIGISKKALKIDVLYVTRIQKERLPEKGDGAKAESYQIVNAEFLKKYGLEDALIMHPLPRVDELAYEVDADPRSMYFKQAARGVPVRMALLALLLGTREVSVPDEDNSFVQKRDYPIYRRDFGVRCLNSRCVSIQKTETRYIKPEFKLVDREPLTLRCVYCEHEVQPSYIASSEWHDGRTLDDKKYHRADSHWARKIKPENLILFNTEATAKNSGFKPSHYARARH
ncbi:Aspartate carbamoyltransferase [subsurface metagenome]